MSDIYYTLKEYIEILENLLNRVEKVPFEAVDSTAVGNKYTQCSWGLCCDTVDVYNKPELNLSPEKFIESNYVSPKDFKKNQLCPHDKRKKGGIQGCFYSCIYKNFFDMPTIWSKAGKIVTIRRIKEKLHNARKILNE